MQNRKWYEGLIWIVYAAMILVCAALNLYSAQAGTLANLIVNILMFILVGVIFFACERNSFRPAAGIIGDLKRVTGKIRDDALHSHRFLWEKYREEKEELFTDKTLKSRYQDYQYEMDRILHSENAYYKCDIADYINYDMIDTVMHRNLLNQVPGVMTGLGILGTFIGLSLGLQSFSAGTTAEIANSIEPLMGGIKVAFHTSIYGMVFSLVFNFVCKRRVDDAENAVREFITAYKKYVLPDTTTDGVNRLMELEQQQTEAIRSLAVTVAHQLSEGLNELLTPQFDRFDRTITDFGNMATRNQMDALAQVLDAFLKAMDDRLNGSFSRLSATITETLKVQRENERQVKEIYDRTGTNAENLEKISRENEALIRALDRYAADVQMLQEETVRTLSAMKEQNRGMKELTAEGRQYASELARNRESLDTASGMLSKQLQEQSELLRSLQKTMASVPRNVDASFKAVNDSLLVTENHLRDSMDRMRETADQVQNLASYSYEGIEQGFDRAAQGIEDLCTVLEDLNRYYTSRFSRR